VVNAGRGPSEHWIHDLLVTTTYESLTLYRYLHCTTANVAAFTGRRPTEPSIADKNRLNPVKDNDKLPQWGPCLQCVSMSARSIPWDIAADQRGRWATRVNRYRVQYRFRAHDDRQYMHTACCHHLRYHHNTKHIL